MNVIVFGAAGNTGRTLVTQALAQGHRVTAFVRRPERLQIEHAALRVVRGDVADTAAVEGALPGHDAVISVLGNSPPLKPDPALVNGIRQIVRAMERNGPRRLIYLSNLTVREGRKQLGLLFRLLFVPILRAELADQEEKESAIRNSTLDWTIVRPPKLTDGPATGSYRHGCDIRATSIIPTISRADVADFLLRQLADRSYIHKAPAVMH
jgi:putative NADH-flavin reductase